MSFSDREIAESFSVSLSQGWTDRSEIIAWADSVMVRDVEPDVAICELCALNDAELSEVIAALGRVAGAARPHAVTLLVFERLSNRTRSGLVEASAAAKWIFMSASYDQPEFWGEMAYEAMGYWDSIDLARDGIYGDPKEMEAQFHAFLEAACEVLRGKYD